MMARILIVDDEPSIVNFVDQAMRLAGHATMTASNASAALRICASDEPIDLLITDYKMPGMDGDVLAAELRQREPDLKVLYLTGYADQLFTERRSTLWRGEAFLEKPCTLARLVEAVSMILAGTDGDFREGV